jgi:hypothetical protein
MTSYIHGLPELILLKMTILPKVTYNLYKNSNDILYGNRKKSHEILMETEKTQTAKTIVSKRRNSRGITMLDFKFYYRIIVRKIAWY